MKPYILSGTYFSDALEQAIWDCFKEQYGKDFFDRDDDDEHWFLAISFGGGKEFMEHYNGNPAWEATK
jgi:hypothetical protein